MSNIVSLPETKRNFKKTFNDGIVKNLYRQKHIQSRRQTQKTGLCLKYVLRFNYQTIGIQRNYEAMQGTNKIERINIL